MRNGVQAILERQRVVVLDGGLATTLEDRGLDLDDPLWSAKVLLEAPAAIRAVHRDFLRAGADCITSASYQASMQGLTARGLSHEESVALLQRSIELAVVERDAFWDDKGHRGGRCKPLVAASVGPYGAYLADGSEYSGHYELEPADLMRFHRDRWNVLAETNADLLACETIPSGPECAALLELLQQGPDATAWFSFSCGGEKELWDGTPLRDVARMCDNVDQVVAVGVNCTAPQLIPSLIDEVRTATNKPVVAYPNAGGRYDAAAKRWIAGPERVDLVAAATDWLARGAQLIGGCCRVGPDVIYRMRAQLL